MEEWEYRYLHDKAVRDACYACHDLSPPEDKYGTLTPAPMKIMMKYDGKKFWKFMDKQGHNFAEYSKCSCHKQSVRA